MKTFTPYNVSMNRNIEREIIDIAEVIKTTKTDKETLRLFEEIFTAPELETLKKRWCILKMLSEGKSQREIAKTLQVSLCKVTRGAKILKDKKSVVTNYMIKENNYDQ